MLFCDTVQTNGGSIGLKRDKCNRITKRPLCMDGWLCQTGSWLPIKLA